MELAKMFVIVLMSLMLVVKNLQKHKIKRNIK